ncbi:MAG: hypothetical protein HQL69_08875 [Magnetococcales bacterium]|nr:hypothetical protein [Magnetococcales bacterium]
MGIYCDKCGYEKQPWHAMGVKECINCINIGFNVEYKFYVGISLLLGIIAVGTMISLMILADYW